MTTEEAIRIKGLARHYAGGLTPEETEEISQDVLLYCLSNEDTFRKRHVQQMVRDCMRTRYGRNNKNQPTFQPLTEDIPAKDNALLRFELSEGLQKTNLRMLQRAFLKLDTKWGFTDVEIGDLFDKTAAWVGQVRAGKIWAP